jgi:hypothetical protein
MFPIHAPNDKHEAIVHEIRNKVKKRQRFDIDIHMVPLFSGAASSGSDYIHMSNRVCSCL